MHFPFLDLVTLTILFRLTSTSSILTTIDTIKELDQSPVIPIDYDDPDVISFLQEISTATESASRPTFFERETLRLFRTRDVEGLKRQLACCVCLDPLHPDSLTTVRCGHVMHQTCYNSCVRAECPACRGSPKLAKTAEAGTETVETGVTKLLTLLARKHWIPPLDSTYVASVVEKLTDAEVKAKIEAEARIEAAARAAARAAAIIEAAAAAEAEFQERNQGSWIPTFQYMHERVQAHIRLLRCSLSKMVEDLENDLEAVTLCTVVNCAAVYRANKRTYLFGGTYNERKLRDNLFLGDRVFRRRWLPDFHADAIVILGYGRSGRSLIPSGCISPPKTSDVRHAAGAIKWLRRFVDEMYDCTMRGYQAAIQAHESLRYRSVIVYSMNRLVHHYSGSIVRNRSEHRELQNHGNMILTAESVFLEFGADAFLEMYQSGTARSEEFRMSEVNAAVHVSPPQEN